MKRISQQIVFLCECILFCTIAFAEDIPPSLKPAYTLNELINTAAQRNPAVLIAEMEARQSKISVREAWGAAFPVIEGGLFGQYQINPIGIDDIAPGFKDYFYGISGMLGHMGFPPMPPFPEPENWGFQFSAELTQPIFTWGKIANSISLAKAGLEAKNLQKMIILRENETQIAVRCGMLYYLIKMEKVLAEQEKTVLRLRVLAGDNLKNNLILPIEAAAINVHLMEITAGKARVTDQKRQMISSIGQLTGLYDIDSAYIDYSFIPYDIFSLPRIALEKSNDYIYSTSTESSLFKIQEKVADTQKKIIGSDSWAKPDIGLKLGYSFSSPRFFFIEPEWQTKGRWNFTASIAINSTIFNGGRDVAQLQKAGIDTEIARQQSRQNLASLQAKLEELDSSLTLKMVLAQYYSLRQKQNKNTAEQKVTEFEHGYSDETAMLQANLNLYSGVLEELQNMAAYYSDYCIYMFLCGKYPEDYLNIP